ncbi:MAG: 4Fe-4S binding protein [Candidatus Omnitrophica bacterium]|jgi:ferredoxin|nr:4Fe-4S binding protein [Candidatus Omnitrophota bacterium]
MAKEIKVRIDRKKCDGCGKCVIACHEGVIKIINGKAKVVNGPSCDGLGACIGGCPRGAITIKQQDHKVPARGSSRLRNWPIQLALISPDAPFLKKAELLIAADCAGFSLPEFHKGLLAGKALINFCPKLDTVTDVYLRKLTEIFKKDDIKSVTIAHMEVPCCFGLVKIVKEALAVSGEKIPCEEVTVTIDGQVERGKQ